MDPGGCQQCCIMVLVHLGYLTETLILTHLLEFNYQLCLWKSIEAQSLSKEAYFDSVSDFEDCELLGRLSDYRSLLSG